MTSDPGQQDAEVQPPPSPRRGAGTAERSPQDTPLWNNFITMAGMFLAIIALLGLVTFGLFHLVTPVANPYVDIIGYLVIPGILVVGLVVMPLGVLVRSWRLRRRDPTRSLALRFPRIDLNDPTQRRAAKIVVVGTLILLPVVAASSYHGYHYTDSASFCSKPCHSVMEPQATAYEYSAHARVPCAGCHIGSGASWFVKSKLSGVRQVWATWLDSYPRPIPPAITELRPARDTCEACHWPEKFFGAQLAEIVRYSSDEQNTRHEVKMLLKTGGADEATGEAQGIHTHVAPSCSVEYVATDEFLQNIPWVKLTKADGSVRVYRSDGKPASAPQPQGQMRRVDCMDCHNRPAHRFSSPSDALDLFLERGLIDPALPFIKRQAGLVLAQAYPDVETAETEIANSLNGFYSRQYPELAETQRTALDRAIDGVRQIHARNSFPIMKVDWRTYPDNIGHKVSPGCFRCHDGRHVDEHGEAISRDCEGCHTFLTPKTEEGNRIVLVEHGQFKHSMPLEGPHAELRCDQCHTGIALESACAGCHTAQADFRAGRLAGFDSAELPAEPMADGVECQECHDPSQPYGLESIGGLCADCHDDEYAEMLTSWKQEIDRLLSEVKPADGPQGERLLQALRHAGPLHNPEAAKIVIRSLTAGRTGGRPTTSPTTDQVH